jgi:hypothetical protein
MFTPPVFVAVVVKWARPVTMTGPWRKRLKTCPLDGSIYRGMHCMHLTDWTHEKAVTVMAGFVAVAETERNSMTSAEPCVRHAGLCGNAGSFSLCWCLWLTLREISGRRKLWLPVSSKAKIVLCVGVSPAIWRERRIHADKIGLK